MERLGIFAGIFVQRAFGLQVNQSPSGGEGGDGRRWKRHFLISSGWTIFVCFD
ncbi:hypothetical protein WN51_03424 [Melipona quadrifasciata]|uniref:Uncharacterized protein n=1 Tax=Melipona quadrifasciata TaxID=166423 RepID=A0A0M8ZXQ5_9HYME|nr:hypothetical protein WN51_03424 [Melipona quadrifasciata]